MHLERIIFFVSFAVLQILIDLVNIDAKKEVELRVEDRFTYESTAQFDVIGIERFDSLDESAGQLGTIPLEELWHIRTRKGREQLLDIRTYQRYQSNFGNVRSNFGNGSRRPITGTYFDVKISPSDIYGGATRDGNYPFARSNTFYSLRLDKAADFFGLWVSSADDYNIVRFFHHDEKVFEYSVKNVVEGLGARRDVFKGNPTYSSWLFGRGNSGEEYLFINAFFMNCFYDQVQFVQEGRGCFESDNHSVGNWTQTSGRRVMTVTVEDD